MKAARILFTAMLLLAGGCGSVALRGADPEALHSATLAEACPLGVPGTRVQVAETKDGVEVSFVTRPSKVEELRMRVRDQALVIGPDRHRGRGHLGEHGGARGHGLRLWSLPPLRAEVADTAAGAKLAIAAEDPARRFDVARAVVDRAARIRTAECF